MVALNGTSLNGASLHDAPVNGGWIPPANLPRHGAGSRAAKNGSTDSLHHDAVRQPGRADPPLDGDLARLEAEVALAKARVDSTKDRLADRDADVRARLRVELIASRDAVAQMEREFDVALAMIREAARTEVERILTEARERAEIRSRAELPGATDGQ
ncbi:MAG: hypothetical protein ACXWBO_17195 [Ilumatobacteraceae bacterium]